MTLTAGKRANMQRVTKTAGPEAANAGARPTVRFRTLPPISEVQ